MRGGKLRQTQQDDFEGLTSIPIERRGICPRRERNDMKPEFARCLSPGSSSLAQIVHSMPNQ